MSRKSTTNPQRPGRPRSDASRDATLLAAFELLRERPFAEFAIDAVARRAGVGKATIYRWWASHGELAVDAFFAHTVEALRFPTAGTARENFIEQVQQLRALLAGPTGGALWAMIGGARSDSALGRALLERWVVPRKRWGEERMARAIADGECLTDLDVDAALDLLYGPLYARLMMYGKVPSERETRAYLDLAAHSIFRR
jgi:AcrR family transcriptional regulator